MNDNLTKTQRSYCMSQNKGKDTNSEKKVRSELHFRGFRFRKNDKRYPGKPDIVLPKYKCIIFINGCFWHGHKGCKASKLPDSNRPFWEKKISDNINRDVSNISELEELGFRVITVWECELVAKANRATRLERLKNEIIM
ncbi:MAG: DNA mismatch endonuclease Vsr [Candidatus Neomarinimicrobiota bacterium]